ncbi:MAG TPA: hypothetical protein VMA83_06395 [Solirubrobacteraceae bacterium]|nr:hypothetical protein [Solirubrobacteraceae bacterium]
MRCGSPLIPACAVTLTALSLLVAGCGGGSSTTAARTAQNRALAYSRCIRSHGVRKYPDPNSSEVIPKETPQELTVSASQFQAAQEACMRLLPTQMQGGERQAEDPKRYRNMLALSRCIRHHGIPNFPNPDGSGQMTPQMLADAGIDLHRTAVLEAAERAADECVGVTHGEVTKAKVARFAAGR